MRVILFILFHSMVMNSCWTESEWRICNPRSAKIKIRWIQWSEHTNKKLKHLSRHTNGVWIDCSYPFDSLFNPLTCDPPHTCWSLQRIVPADATCVDVPASMSNDAVTANESGSCHRVPSRTYSAQADTEGAPALACLTIEPKRFDLHQRHQEHWSEIAQVCPRSSRGC